MNTLYIKQLKKIIDKYNSINYALLFGSSLKKRHPTSDVDILIGGKLQFKDMANLLSDLELLLKKRVDIIVSQEASPVLVLKAFKEGHPISIRAKDKLKEDYFNIFYKTDDLVNLKKIREERIKREYCYGK